MDPAHTTEMLEFPRCSEQHSVGFGESLLHDERATAPRSARALLRRAMTMLERTYAHLLSSSAEAARQRMDVFTAQAERKEGRLGH